MTKTFINWFDKDRNFKRKMSTPLNYVEPDDLVKASDS